MKGQAVRAMRKQTDSTKVLISLWFCAALFSVPFGWMGRAKVIHSASVRVADWVASRRRLIPKYWAKYHGVHEKIIWDET